MSITEEKVKVKLNIFDLLPSNKVLRFCHTGIYHTSVNINEKSEYYFGFSQFGYTGIDSPQKLNKLPSSMTGSFYSSVEMGYSPYTSEQCDIIIQSFKDDVRWLSDHYNFLFHNCNTFTFELCCELLGSKNMQNYPKWLPRGELVGRFLYRTSVAYVLEATSAIIPFLGHIPYSENEIEVEEFPNDWEPKYMSSSSS